MAFILDDLRSCNIKGIAEDASISNLNFSKKIGLSPSACLSKTQKKLGGSGIIQKFTTIVDEKN